MLIETQVVRSKSESMKEVQALSVTKALIYRNVDKKSWDEIAKTHQGVRALVVVELF